MTRAAGKKATQKRKNVRNEMDQTGKKSKKRKEKVEEREAALVR